MKKRLFAVISVLLLLTLFVQSTFAAEPRVAVGICPNCEGNMTKNISRTLKSKKTVTCEHYASGGYDTIYTYNVKTTWHCGNCGHDISSTKVETVVECGNK